MKFVYLFVLCILYTLPSTSNGAPARYEGLNADDAGHVLDSSQNKKGFGFNARGHARQHASGDGSHSVEKYSSKSKFPKSGFDSRDDQNHVAHAALSHPKAQAAMDKLNQYHPKDRNAVDHQRQIVDLSHHDLKMSHMSGGEFTKGSKSSSFPIGGATMVLQHHRGQEQNPNAPVHVHTFYPKAAPLSPKSPPSSPKSPKSPPSSPKSPKSPRG